MPSACFKRRRWWRFSGKILGEGRDTSRPPIILILCWISVIWRGREVSRPYHAKSFWRVDTTKKSFYYQGFFAVKRRAVFILGATWIALVRGWRRECVVGGMETRFQWRKAHSRTAKCEAFHVAPRLFFMFFVFDSIHDSATMHNLSPLIFHWTATNAKTENSSTTVKEIKILHKSDKIG